jgi:hypothetical protein
MSWSPKKLGIASGCSFLLSIVFAIVGTSLLITGIAARTAVITTTTTDDVPGGDGGTTTSTGGDVAPVSTSSTPNDGNYECTMQIGAQKAVIRKFSIAANEYTDQSFNQGGGTYEFDSSDGTMQFQSGPFQNHFLGVWVPKGTTPKASSKYQFGGQSPAAEADTIHLLDLNTSYSSAREFGVPCYRAQ